MRKLSYTEIKNIELNLLKTFKNICENNHIDYFLADGTLLGAVRHKGFIPWDDDIDVHVRREDYERLISVLNEVAEERALNIICLQNDHNCERPFLKICDSRTKLVYHGESCINNLGVFIDVFPLDNQGNSLRAGLILEKKIKPFYFMRNISVMRTVQIKKPKDIIKKICFPIAKLFGTEFWVEKVNHLMQSFNKEDCRYYGSNQPTSIICKKEVFASTVMLAFEDELFPAPVGYDDYLKYHYGDYMELPPLKKRVATHSFDAYIDDEY